MRQQLQLSTQDWQLLSAYLDGQLSASDQAKLEKRLREQAELRTALEELKTTRAMLRSAGKQRVPRNFTLTPAMVEKARPRPLLRLIPVLNFASAAAALAVVILLVVGLLPGAGPAVTSAPALAPVESTTTVNAIEDTTGSPVPLIWSAPGGYGGGDGRGGGSGGGGAEPAPDAMTAKGAGGDAGPGFTLPPQAVESLPAAEAPAPSVQQQPAPTEAAGVMMIPAMTATPAPAAPALTGPQTEAPAATEMAVTQVEEPSAPLTGSGPILGVRPPDEAQAENQQAIQQTGAAEPQQPADRGNWWIAPLVLAVVAAAAALASWLIRRKTAM